MHPDACDQCVEKKNTVDRSRLNDYLLFNMPSKMTIGTMNRIADHLESDHNEGLMDISALGVVNS